MLKVKDKIQLTLIFVDVDAPFMIYDAINLANYEKNITREIAPTVNPHEMRILAMPESTFKRIPIII